MIMEGNTPENQLKLLLSKIEWNFLRRKEWTRKCRSKNITETYSHIFLALTKLIKVIKLVLRCYDKYPKLYKRLGPHSRNGGLEIFLDKVQSIKLLFEELLTDHLRLSLPRSIPSELVKIILDFSVLGNRKLDVGFYSKKKLDQICEGIQRRKFLTLVNTLTISLYNAVLCNKMELGGFTIEAQMECFTKDLKAFEELSDESNTDKDFSKFSKLEIPNIRRRRNGLQQYRHSLSGAGISGRSRRMSRRPTTVTHDYAVFLL